MTDVRTPRAAVAIVRFSASTRGPPAATSSSVPSRPGAAIASMSVPEVPTKGLPVPASASSIASTAARSAAAAPAMSPERMASCLNARWMTPSARPRPIEDVEIVEVPGRAVAPAAVRAAADGVGAGEAGDLVPGGEEFGDDGGADVAAGAGDEYAHDAEPQSLV